MYTEIFMLVKWRHCAKENAIGLCYPSGGQRPGGNKNGWWPFRRLIKEYQQEVGYIIEELSERKAINIQVLQALACLIKRNERNPKRPNIVFVL